MNFADLQKILATNNENEHLEFKEAKNNFSVLGESGKHGKQRNCIYGYTVALANEGGGKLILGVSNKKNCWHFCH